MASPQPEVAVAFTIREKFAWSLASLQRLYALTQAPFRLYFVDGRYPASVRAELDAFLADKTNVVRLPAPRFLYPSEALNLAMTRISEKYVFLMQNDVLVARGALDSLLRTAEQLGCDGVSPDVLDTDFGEPQTHRESTLPLAIRERDERIWIEPDASPERRDGYRRLHHFEVHCVLLKSQALRDLGQLAPLSVHDHVDMALGFWRRGRTVYFDHAARVLYMDVPPLRLRDYECDYFRFRWDRVRSRQSHEYVQRKWRMGNLFDSTPFVDRQHGALRAEAVLTRYDTLLEPDQWPAEISP